MLGGTVAVSGADDGIHHRSGGWVGLGVGVMLLVSGAAALMWVLRTYAGTAVTDWEELRVEGDDDGLPLGAFRQGQRVGLEASDQLLILAALSVGLAVVILACGLSDPDVGSRFALGFSLFWLVPGALLGRLGTGVAYWLDPDGVVRRNRSRVAVRWVDVERIVPMRQGSPASNIGIADAFELHVRTREHPKPSRWLKPDFTLYLRLVETSRHDLWRLLDDRVRSARADRR
jgi:hypothetical protein